MMWDLQQRKRKHLILAGIEKKLFWNIKKQGRIIGSAVGWISDQIRSNYQWEKEKRSHSFNGGWGV
jgi:hypothetical protein